MRDNDTSCALLDGVSHEFTGRDRTAVPTLRDVSLTVRQGEFVSIIGPSGCGKTTILNMLAGIIRPLTGRVELDGEPVRGPQAGKVAYMFARDGLLPWRTAERNVELAMEMRRSRPGKGAAAELLRTVGLAGFGDHYPSQLSQGMRQRVALARTLAVAADLWLMDEPFAALDAQTRAVIQAQFAKVWEDTGKTAVLVTHDLAEAIVLSDRVVVMTSRPGRIRSTYDIDLPRPRSVLDLQDNPKFTALHGRLWADLRDEFDHDGAA